MMFSGLISRWTMPAAVSGGESGGDLSGDMERFKRSDWFMREFVA
jgi:hypothetical protein